MATLRFMLEREKKEHKQMERDLKRKAENIELLERHVAKESVSTYTCVGQYKDDRKVVAVKKAPSKKSAK